MFCGQKQEMRTPSSVSPSTTQKQSRELDLEIGQSIRFHRKNANLSMQELASQLGITYQQVQRYEIGTNRISAIRLLEIARVLDIPVTSFFEGDYARTLTGMVPDSHSMLLGRQLLTWFLRIDDSRKRRAVLDYVSTLAQQK